MSNNPSIFWATSWDIVKSTCGSDAKRGFSATLMAADCSVMAIWFLVVSNWLNFEVCRTSYKHRWGVTLCSPAAAKFASHFLPTIFQPSEIFCPAPGQSSFSAACTGLWSVPFITSFPFWAGGIYRMRIWARGHKKASDIHWRSLKRKQYGGHFHLSSSSFLTHSLRSNGWVFVDMGKTALAEICVDGCEVVSENSESDVTNWLDLNNRWPSGQLATNSKHHFLNDCKAPRENFYF